MKNLNRPKSYNTRSYLQKTAITNRKLRNGDVLKLSKKIGFHPSYMSDVLTGLEFDKHVLNNAFNMVRDRKDNLELI